MSKRFPRALYLPAALALAATISLATWAGTMTPAAAIGQQAPAFTLHDQNDKSVSLSDFKGKIVVLEWINKDCPFVQRHLKAKTMETLAEKYKSDGVVWIAVDSTSTHNSADRLKTVTDNGLTYPVLDDAAGTVGKEYGAKTTPDMFIINKDGALAYDGGIDNDPEGNKSDRVNYVSKALDEMLAGKAVSQPETKSYGCGIKYAK